MVRLYVSRLLHIIILFYYSVISSSPSNAFVVRLLLAEHRYIPETIMSVYVKR